MRILIFVMIFLNVVYVTSAQEKRIKLNNKDAECWTSVSLETNFSKKFRNTISQELRLDNNISSYKSTFTDIGFLYKFNRYIRISGNYRFAITGNALRNRLYGNLFLRYRFNNIRISYRARMQTQYEEGNDLPENYFRNKIKAAINSNSSIDPYIASELYYRILNIRSQFDKYRLSVGFNWSLGKKSEINIFYLYQREINTFNPKQDFIIGAGYNYTLK